MLIVLWLQNSNFAKTKLFLPHKMLDFSSASIDFGQNLISQKKPLSAYITINANEIYATVPKPFIVGVFSRLNRITLRLA